MNRNYETGYHKMYGYQGPFLIQNPNIQVKTIVTNNIKNSLSLLYGFFYIQENLLSNDIEPNLSSAQKDFQTLIKKRCEYLDGLTRLPKNWIDGNPEIPNKNSIKLGKQILKDCLNYTLKNDYDIPDLIMCPLPTGGVSIEFKKNSDSEICISINNNGNIDIESMISGKYFSDEEPVKNIEAVITRYGKFIR